MQRSDALTSVSSTTRTSGLAPGTTPGYSFVVLVAPPTAAVLASILEVVDADARYTEVGVVSG
jgi:hypothetical protein